MSYSSRGPDPTSVRWILALLTVALACLVYLIYSAWSDQPERIPADNEILLVD